MTISFAFFDDFRLQTYKKQYDFSNDVIKLLLTNGAPSAAWTAISQATEITAQNGYPTGGLSLTTTWGLVGSVATLAFSAYTMTASGVIGPFGYGVLYDSSVGASNNLIAFADLRSLNGGSSITMNSPDTFRISAFNLTV